MDPLSRIRAKINAFPGYGSEADIDRSDQMIRAYLGERLAELQERIGGGSAADALEALIVRSAFADQDALRPLEHPGEDLTAPESLLNADAALLDAADDAAGISAADVGAYCVRISEAFDERERRLMAAGIALR